MPSPLTRPTSLSTKCRCFRSQEDLNQEFFRTRSQYRVTEVRTLLLLPLLTFSPIDEDFAPRVVDRGALSGRGMFYK